MSFRDWTMDDFESYEDFSTTSDRKARRARKPKPNRKPKKADTAIVNEIADADGVEAGFETTYTPGLFEEGWLLEALRPFYDQALISDVLGRVKGGKEANVYRCVGGTAADAPLLAAKVYRPRQFRNLRNDKMYREGRAVLKETGKEVKATDQRLIRALNKKSAYGEQVAHTSWLAYEYTTLRTLHEAGAAVPKPYASASNAILMSYFGDETMGAPTLNDVTLDRDEAEPLFQEVMRNIVLMLSHGLVHGDLSPYNILYWEGDIALIDFPQVTLAHHNSQAEQILQRDITRVCAYFREQGVKCDPDAIARRLWKRYIAKDANTLAADLSRLLEADE